MKNKAQKNSSEKSVLSMENDDTSEINVSSEERLNEFPKMLKEAVWGNSVLQVAFKNEVFAKKYKTKLETFLKDLLDAGEEFVIYSHSHSSMEQEYEGTHQSFHIDKHTVSSYDDSKLSENIPVYSSTFDDVLHFDDSLGNKKCGRKKGREKKSQVLTCFNCCGNHHLKDCPEKLDRSRISRNRKELLTENTSRYHSEEKYNDLKPGVLSPELRTALGLRSNQLPRFIYHMRVIGYPPGWMKDAVFEASGLSLYDTDGNAVTTEHSLAFSGNGNIYDASKFIEYPGFNTPVPDGFIDEWRELNLPPIQSHQQLSEALKAPNIVNSNNMYKRKQQPAVTDSEPKKSKNGEEDSNSNSDLAFDQNSTPKCDNSGTLVTSDASDSKHKKHYISVSKSPGTPILKQGNPYQKLPDADKFAEGITEHLPFENLPDAVGTFEKMRGILSDVQKKLHNTSKS